MTRSWFSPYGAPLHDTVAPQGWRRVLVPLDGSDRSSWAVRQARSLMERPDIEVTLLRVIECRSDRANDMGYQRDVRHGPACSALAEVRAGFAAKTPSPRAEIRFGDPAKEILRETVEGGYDVVLMSTYIQAGLSTTVLGSVALRVLRSSPVPLLLFRPGVEVDGGVSPRGEAKELTLRRCLVALDGSKEGEEILPAAERMAHALGVQLHLFRALTGRGGHASEDRAASEYLDDWRRTLASRRIPAQVAIRSGRVAESALSVVREFGLDCIAISTHARTGLVRAVYGSTAQELLKTSPVPILALCTRRHRLPVPESTLEHRHVYVG